MCAIQHAVFLHFQLTTNAPNKSEKAASCLATNIADILEIPDAVFVFTLDPSEGTYRLAQVMERLLAADSADPI
jgi:hypothetical protein